MTIVVPGPDGRPLAVVVHGHEGNRSSLVRMSDEADVRRVLTAVRPRDCDFVCYDVTDPEIARPVLPELPASRRLLIGGVAGPSLLTALRACWRDEPGAPELAAYLADFFPPAQPVPVLAPRWVEPLREIALGDPGQPVAHGLFPSTPTKLARLALARTAVYPADLVRDAAAEAYGAHRSKYQRSYSGHDAFACALVHPEVDAGPLVERYTRFTRHQHGWRTRHKIHALVRWAAGRPSQLNC
ncbi:hypothetical protein FKR81_30475 [Lentzea tibetensis]|uniref:Uncharacterized protein n=1 Tax=Lentzea tibetensis TaxID=2591470 RepID=A0A563ELQ2_9PSEU|nr:hypothetical protein [Lentzea tibetensis]TWP47993.1 hypothetical protein FKR81_30475 [Lentzea tibetensis]